MMSLSSFRSTRLLLLIAAWGLTPSVRTDGPSLREVLSTLITAAGLGVGAGQLYLAYQSYKAQQLSAPEKPQITFADVAGMTQVKAELAEIVNFLKNPATYAASGARMPKGLLLSGDPGNGKTYIARALAGEAGCSFINITGSEIHAKYWGESMQKVKNLFAQAQKNGPTIIFIDEIDAMGAKRDDATNGAGYREGLNQLLAEMDGFNQPTCPVFVIAATNTPEILDPALTRPGRFDRLVHVGYPDYRDRLELIQYALGKVSASPDLDQQLIAQATHGFSSAAIVTLINEAMLLALRGQRSSLTMADIDEARDRALMGLPNPTLQQRASERMAIAYHEVGHALARVYQDHLTAPLFKITLMPRGNALGLAHHLSDPDKTLYTQSNYLAEITCALAGRAAEEIIYGEPSSGASSDLEIATQAAYQMVCSYGMSQTNGLMSINYYSHTLSPTMRERIDDEVRTILATQYQKALELLRTNVDMLHAVTHALLEKETLTAQEVYAIIGRPLPPKSSSPIMDCPTVTANDTLSAATLTK